jgi:hypothetical protein
VPHRNARKRELQKSLGGSSFCLQDRY